MFWTPQWFSAPRMWQTPALPIMHVTGGVPAPGTAPNWVPGAWPPAEGRVFTPVTIHPILAPNPVDAYSPHLLYDISHDPTTARRRTGRDLVMSVYEMLSDEATYPAVREINIHVDHSLATTNFWGPIVVRAQEKITVYDLLRAVYEYFRKQLTQEEVDFLADLHPDNMGHILSAFQRRCRRTHNLEEYERLQGLMRIDVLGDSTHWWGE